MNITDFVPVYGPSKRTYEIQMGYQTGKLSFTDAWFQSAQAGAMSAAQLLATVHFAPNLLAANKFQRVATRGPVALGVIAASAAWTTLVKPSADVESTEYGAYRVTPRFGPF